MLTRSKKSEKTRQEDLANFYHSKKGQAMLAEGDKKTADAQDIANSAMRKAAKENRGLMTNEIENAIDDLYYQQGSRTPNIRSKSSSARKRYVAKIDKKTGRAEWVPIN